MEAEQADFADFFRAEYQTLLRAIYLISGSRDEAEELAQDAFVKALERWDRVREMDNPAGSSIELRPSGWQTRPRPSRGVTANSPRRTRRST